MKSEIIVFVVLMVIGIGAAVVLYLKMTKARGKVEDDRENDDESIVNEGGTVSDEETIFSEDSIKDRVAADAYDMSNPEYVYICDMGHNIYARSYYVEQLPLALKFATTFRQNFQFPNTTSSVAIVPLDTGKALQALKKNIDRDTADLIEARKHLDVSSEAEIEERQAEHTQWLKELISGQNAFYEVAFLFTVHADTLRQLDHRGDEFISKAKSMGLEMCSCFGWQDLAYECNAPYNSMASSKESASLYTAKCPIKWHILEQDALSCIFNHTSSHFTHEIGIVAGRNMDTGEVVIWNPYSTYERQGFSVAIMGKTGVGKSLTVKIFVARLAHFGYRFACIDTDKSGGRGEYSNVCEAIGGVNFELKTNSSNKLNIFEIDEQEAYDQYLNRSYRVLRLVDKATEVYYIIKYIIEYQKAAPDAATSTFMEKIVKNCIEAVYAEKGIYDGDPDSLYTDNATLGEGLIHSGKEKKELPVMSDAFMWIVRAKRENTMEIYNVAYQMLEDVFSDLVDELYYDVDTLERVPREEYEIREFTKRNIKRVKGTRGYFDGQSNISFDRNTPFINIDISDLPARDKVLGQQVAMNFLTEHFIKKNSENIKDAQRIVMIVDEAHRMFDVLESRKFLADTVRTARKNHASCWVITQNHTDYFKHPETEDILKNVAAQFIFKQDAADRKHLEENTILTKSAVSRLLKLGGDPNEDSIDKAAGKGQVLLIDGNRAAFLQIDYLKEVEAYFAETDVETMKKTM